jgi:hypothetical protein
MSLSVVWCCRRMEEENLLKLATSSRDVGDDSDVSDDTDFSSSNLKGLKISSSSAPSPYTEGALSPLSPLSRYQSRDSDRSTPKGGRGPGSTRSTRSNTTSAGARRASVFDFPDTCLDEPVAAGLAGSVPAAEAIIPEDAFAFPTANTAVDPTSGFDFTIPDEMMPTVTDSSVVLPEGSVPSDLDALDSYFIFNPSVSISFDILEPEEPANATPALAHPALTVSASYFPTAQPGSLAATAAVGSGQSTAATEPSRLEAALGIAALSSTSTDGAMHTSPEADQGLSVLASASEQHSPLRRSALPPTHSPPQAPGTGADRRPRSQQH